MRQMDGRLLIAVAFVMALGILAFLAKDKGCTGGEPVMMSISGIAAALAGILGGIANKDHGVAPPPKAPDPPPPAEPAKTPPLAP